MKNAVLIFICFLGIQALGQDYNIPNLILEPKVDIVLRVVGEDGTNGGAITWNPVHEKYYSVMAGNGDYPIEVYDESGTHLQTIPAGFDLRGIWYNPEYGFVEGNTYEYHDIVSFQMTDDGLFDEDTTYEELLELPVYEIQSVLDLNTQTMQFIWLDIYQQQIMFIDSETGSEVRVLEIEIPVDVESINFTTVAYTGIPNHEYALLNYDDNLVYLINDEDGKISATITLPEDASTYFAFRFACANNRIWLFDGEMRSWSGYKIVD